MNRRNFLKSLFAGAGLAIACNYSRLGAALEPAKVKSVTVGQFAYRESAPTLQYWKRDEPIPDDQARPVKVTDDQALELEPYHGGEILACRTEDIPALKEAGFDCRRNCQNSMCV